MTNRKVQKKIAKKIMEEDKAVLDELEDIKPKSLDEKIKELPADRQAKMQARAEELIARLEVPQPIKDFNLQLSIEELRRKIASLQNDIGRLTGEINDMRDTLYLVQYIGAFVLVVTPFILLMR